MITISPHAWCKGTKFASTKYLFGMWTLPSWKKKKKNQDPKDSGRNADLPPNRLKKADTGLIPRQEFSP